MLLPVGNILLKFCASGENNLMFNIKLLEFFNRKMASDIPNFAYKVLQSPMRSVLTVGLTHSRWGWEACWMQQQDTHLMAATPRIQLWVRPWIWSDFSFTDFFPVSYMRSGSPPLDAGQALLGLPLLPSPLFRVKLDKRPVLTPLLSFPKAPTLFQGENAWNFLGYEVISK